MQLYILFDTKHVIRKTRFLKLQDLEENFFFFLAQVVHEVLNTFSAFSLERYLLWYSSLKVESISRYSPFVPFFNFANHVYGQDVTNDIL